MLIWRTIRLAAAIRSAVPDVPAERALPAAIAIEAHHGQHDPLLIAAIAAHESRLDWREVNGGGCWGAMQRCGARPRRWTEAESYIAGVRRLDDAVAECRKVRRCGAVDVLAAYCSGPDGVRGRWYAMPRAILRRRDALRRAMGVRPGAEPTTGAGS